MCCQLETISQPSKQSSSPPASVVMLKSYLSFLGHCARLLSANYRGCVVPFSSFFSPSRVDSNLRV